MQDLTAILSALTDSPSFSEKTKQNKTKNKKTKNKTKTKKIAKILTDPLFNFLALAFSIKILVSSCSYLNSSFKAVSKNKKKKSIFNGLSFNVMENLLVRKLFPVILFLSFAVKIYFALFALSEK